MDLNFRRYIEYKGILYSDHNEIEGDNEVYYRRDERVYSLRFNPYNFFKIYKHIDFFMSDYKRPYMRTYLDDSGVPIYERYYEVGTWNKLYDVFLNEDFSPDYTILYDLEGGSSVISWSASEPQYFKSVVEMHQTDW